MNRSTLTHTFRLATLRLLHIITFALILNIAFFATGARAGELGGLNVYATGGIIDDTDNIAAADFNRDGRLDVVVTQGNPNQQSTQPGRTVAVFFGNGDGTFNPNPTRLGSGYNAVSVFTPDMNGDGFSDIVYLSYEYNTSGSGYNILRYVAVILSNGNGTFQPEAEYIVGDVNASHSASSLGLGDIDGDGRRDDPVVYTNDGKLYTFLNPNNGVLNAPVVTVIGGTTRSYNVIYSADLNADGKWDVIVNRLSDPHPIIRYSNGDGSFGGGVTLSISMALPNTIQSADLTGDGKHEIFFGGIPENDGTDAPIYEEENTASGVNLKPIGYNDNKHHRVYGMKLADMNGDAKADIVTVGQGGNSFSKISIFPQVGVGGFGAPILYQIPAVAESGGTTRYYNLRSLVVRDFNNDGRNDVVFTYARDNGLMGILVSQPEPTTTTLTSNVPSNTTNEGDAVGFTARVTSNNGTPVGSVTFKDNGTPLCAGPLNANGEATCGTAQFPVGSHRMTAEYHGYSGFNPSTSNAITHTVNPSAPRPITLPAIADAYVRGAVPDANFGAVGELQVKRTLNAGSGKGRQAYMRFDTSSVAGSITSAKLRIFCRLSAVNSNIPLAVFPVSNSTWTETGLTWNNKPAPNVPTTLAQVTVTDTTARWYEFDITSFIQQERAAGRMVTGLILRNMTAGANGDHYTAINSRETPANQPQLVIVK